MKQKLSIPEFWENFLRESLIKLQKEVNFDFSWDEEPNAFTIKIFI